MGFDPRKQKKVNSTNHENGEEKKRCEFFLKIGRESYDPETDTRKFVSVPSVMGLDTMEKNQVFGTGEFPELLSYGNTLLDQLLEAAQSLSSGEEREINLKVKLCRRKVREEPKFKAPNFGIQFIA